jgi:transposase
MPKFLTEEQVLILRQAHRTIKDKKLADRIKAILSLNQGFEYSQVARILLLDEITLRRYVKSFKEKGLDGLLELHYSGGQSKLAQFQELELKNHLAESEHIYLTAKEVVDYVKHKYGINYSVIGITKLLHRLGFVYKKPKLAPAKADLAKQQQFLDGYFKLKNELKENDQIYFLDATHPQHNTRSAYGWILRGTDKLIKSNTGRDRVNLNGALNAKTHEVVIREDDRINSISTINLLNQLLKKHPTGRIYLIWDNARYYYSKIVQNYLRYHPRLIPKFLPPYSPNLNLIERLWRLFHQKVTYNQYYETFPKFKESCLKFFENIYLYRKEMNSLLTDSFQLITT